MTHEKLTPYTILYAQHKTEHTLVPGLISGDGITLRIDVYDDLENYVVLEDCRRTSRPLTYT